MPEGDVVWRAARQLDEALTGRELVRCDLRWPSLATSDLTGRQVTGVVSAGKHLLVRVAGTDRSPALTLHSHLRMEGSWRVLPAAEAEATASRHDVRAVLGNQRWTAVGRRLGMLDLLATTDEHTVVGHLGPDLLGPGWDAGTATANLAADPARAVGDALLDQRLLAGVGTFYMSEVLFVLGLTPWTPVGDVPDLRTLVVRVREMLALNARSPLQTTTGDTRAGRRQYVHARSGLPCRRCGTTVRVALIGDAPRERTAFYCPSCQRGPAPTDDGRPQRPLGAGRRGRGGGGSRR